VILEMSMLLQRFLLASCGEQARGPKTVVGISFKGPFVRNEVRPANRMGFPAGSSGSSRWGLQTVFFRGSKVTGALSDRIKAETNFAEVSGLVLPQDKVYRVRRSAGLIILMWIL
jgi:hypothetical protein